MGTSSGDPLSGSVPAVTALVPVVATLTIRLTFKNLFVLLVFLVFVVVLAAVSSRLLGISVPRWRSVLTAFIGTLIGAVGAEAVIHGKDASVAYALSALFGVLATMVLMIVPEAVGSSAV